MPSTNHAPVDLPEQVVAIAATFTAEPIEDFLDFFMGELELRARIQFAPFNQVLQQLLDPSSQLARNCHGFNVLLVRLEDLDHAPEEPQAYPQIGLPGHAGEFADAIDTFLGRTALPLLVLICPPSSPVAQDTRRHALNQQVEACLALRLGRTPGVSVVTSVPLMERFPRLSYYAPRADAEGGVPYTPRFFAGLARHLVRRIAALGTVPRKVILLDADGTLWKGICGEDGWAGVEIGNAQRALQTFMLRKHDEGMLLCVCSKNNRADVWAVFDNHPDMVLRREHITAWRVNWDRKSENIRSLAAALSLGMDSFILVDDSVLERTEVEAGCPGVLTVRLPDDSRLVPSFLENFWAFDRPRVTDEDSARTELYRHNARREDLRSASAGLRSFLRGLDLQIDIAAMEPPHVSRVTQLTQRTSQFNIRRIPRSEAEVNALLSTEHTECLVVDARDRFGAYGLVGVLVAEIRPNTVYLDTFLLSCRALGRGVEHRMLAAIGAQATQRGIPFVEVPLIKTSRNKPAVEFLERVASRFRTGSGDQVVYRLPAEAAAEISIEDYLDAADIGDPIPATLVETANGNARGRDFDEVARLHHIATALDDDDKVLAAVERYRQRERPQTLPVPLAPRSSIEIELAKLWTQVLGVNEVGADDDFFDLGGHSILAMELISRVGDTFGVELPLRGVFETPTLAGLAAAIMARVDPSREPDHAAYGLPAVTPDPEHRGEPFPLSDIQQAYWVGRDAGFELGNVAAHFYIEVDYVDLDIGRFNAAWRHLIQRHGMLRAVIRPDGRQQILDTVPEYHIEVLDLRAAEPAMAEATLTSMRNRLSHEVRETDRWPLFEICAARLDAHRVRVYYSFDLLIADAFSLLLLARESMAQYNNPSAALEPPALSFRDYVLAEA
ncbi:MAG: HAD-IIIC family phosphatase, partial [Chloroflexota bacterium]|nr:HAD-IIIC family phosphatase [Chloroflexota bacterium]